MRFTAAEIDAIVQNRKTQFRVPLGLPATVFNPQARTHSVMPSGIDLSTGAQIETEPLDFLVVVRRRVQHLALVTLEDVRAEGFKNHEKFWRAFMRRWNIREYVAPEVCVHVVEFEREATRRPIFMARQQGINNPPQYTNRPSLAIDNTEVVPVEEISPTWRARAAENYTSADSGELRRRANRRRIEQLREQVALAERSGVDVDEELTHIDAAIARLADKVAASEAA